MNLKEEMVMNSFCENKDSHERLIKLSDAIEIAEKYAEEMCKKQKEICIKAAWNTKYKEGESNINAFRPKTPMQVREDLISAPLATEIK